MMLDTPSAELIKVARGDAPATLLLRNAKVVDVFTLTVHEASVAVHDGRIAGVGDYQLGAETIDLRGAFVAPGFIDAHMHVESTFLPPSRFVQLAAPRGTVAAVFDPHEIANVLGLDGIRFVMDDAAGLPFTSLFALSSCVPASHLETSGASLAAHDLEPFFADPRVVALAEVMNFPGVVAADRGLLAKISLGLRRHVVDGHAPGLRGKALQAYASAGISSDHECVAAAEAVEKVRAGLRVFIREGSAARNLEALLPAVDQRTFTRFCFCTDDRHPADLIAREGGHIDHVVRRAVRLGLDPLMAIAIASINAAEQYRRPDLGAVAPGRAANLVVFDDLRDIRPRMVFHEGRMVACDGEYLGVRKTLPAAASRRTVVLGASLAASSFEVPVPEGASTMRVIGMHADQLVTESLAFEASTRVVNGRGVAVSDPSRDVLKLAVIERHRGGGGLGLGFVHGFGLKAGAIASTVGHDSHNLAVVGVNDDDMLLAARTLESVGGGQCVVRGGEVLAVLSLRIAGLMSDQSPQTVITQQASLLAAAGSLGCPHHDPFMPLSFLPLAVIPSLKLTDRGLVDVVTFEFTSLWR